MKNLTVKRFLMAMVLTVLVGCSIHMVSANALDNTPLAETENLDEVPTNTSVYPLEVNEKTTIAPIDEEVNEDTNEEKPEEVNDPEEIKEEVKKETEEVNTEEMKEEKTNSTVENTENSIDNVDEEIPTTNEEVKTETPEKVEDNYACAGDAYQTQLLNDINAYRVANGLGTLTLDSRLNSSAFVRAQEASTCWSHTRPNGSHWSTSLTFSAKSMADEDLGQQYAGGMYVVEAWKNSPTHNQSILTGSFTKCGIGYYNAPDGSVYVALHLY